MNFQVGAFYRTKNDTVVEIKSTGPHYFIAQLESGIQLSYDMDGNPLSGNDEFQLVEIVRRHKQ